MKQEGKKIRPQLKCAFNQLIKDKNTTNVKQFERIPKDSFKLFLIGTNIKYI